MEYRVKCSVYLTADCLNLDEFFFFTTVVYLLKNGSNAFRNTYKRMLSMKMTQSECQKPPNATLTTLKSSEGIGHPCEKV